jgi:ABC-2 type transport system permease protein
MISDIITIWQREMIRYFRSKSRIITSLVMPILWLGVMGTALGSTLGGVQFPGGLSYLSFIAPGILAMAVLFTSIFSGISVIYDREFGFLKEILVAPVSRTSIVLGKALGGTTSALIQGIIMLGISLVFGVQFLGEFGLGVGFFGAILVMFLIGIGLVSLGIAIASKLQNMEGFQMVINLLVMPMFFLSGAMYPVKALPGWLKNIVYIDPLSYGVDALRHFLIGPAVASFPLWLDLGVLFAFFSVMLALGTYLFRKV